MTNACRILRVLYDWECASRSERDETVLPADRLTVVPSVWIKRQPRRMTLAINHEFTIVT